MIERLSHEPASLPAEDDDRSDRLQALELLRAHLSRTISEGLEQGSVAGQGGDIDNVQIAALLDGSLPRAEWDAVAARLVKDPVARAELAAAVALLDEIEAQPATVPAELIGRAAGVLAASEQGRPRVSAAVASVAWYRRSMAWSSFALVALAVVAVPAVLKMAGEGTPVAVKPGDPGDTFSRGIVASPSNPTKKKDAQSCIDANEPARKPTPDNTGNDRRTATPATANGAARPVEAPAESNDPCGPKPSGAGKQERRAPAGAN
ncbi:hypothetical protein [Bradyrhizobium sp. BWA-3-5]|uniref:hypothetical protein n=1 Tax=Bradyrhizobium sp. BWA-3-5 TaxID=3080013 RepID=UPI00293EAD70|nr:hypothetical protein [Bradyrhizobium sp. BWA-3-5]WOH68575.1 hypothetical protein RX331_13000 [Bradyrhizobium sp. BWA-3-5]